jgi:hypothetical protein
MKFQKKFLPLWVIFAHLDPDPDSEYGSGSTDLIESGFITDQVPKPCLISMWIKIQLFTHCGSGSGAKSIRIWILVRLCCHKKFNFT